MASGQPQRVKSKSCRRRRKKSNYCVTRCIHGTARPNNNARSTLRSFSSTSRLARWSKNVCRTQRRRTISRWVVIQPRPTRGTSCSSSSQRWLKGILRRKEFHALPIIKRRDLYEREVGQRRKGVCLTPLLWVSTRRAWVSSGGTLKRFLLLSRVPKLSDI